MRKQTKLVAVVSASALLALGASLTSFAASKGTWMMVDGEWYCYDKNGDAYENTFCTSNGKDYYVGDDGQLVRSAWVEDDGNYYFVNSAGQKITNDWRLTAPYDDDSAEEQWYYFKSNGKRAEDEKITYKGKTYFFDSEGEMLTGWVQKSGDGWDEASTADVKGIETYYCDETGVRLENSWVYDYAPDVDQDDINSDDDEHWYYLKSSGKAATGKKSNVKGQTYFFDEEGKMLSGWVVKTGSNGYTQAWNDDDDTDGHFETTLSELNASEIHFCGDEDDGHMKKDKWVKAYSNTQYGEDDDDNDKYWFWINKSGDVYVPAEQPINDAQDIVANLLTANPDKDSITAVFAAWDEPAIGAAKALQEAGRDEVIVTGVDGNEQAVEMIKDGTNLKATVKQNFEGMADIVCEQMEKYFDGEEIEKGEMYAPAELITQENAQ